MQNPIREASEYCMGRFGLSKDIFSKKTLAERKASGSSTRRRKT